MISVGVQSPLSSNEGNGVNALISIFYQITIPSIAIASRWKFLNASLFLALFRLFANIKKSTKRKIF